MFSSRKILFTLAAAGLGLAGIGIWRSRSGPPKEAAGPAVVAVATFINLSSEAKLDWIGESVPALMSARAEGLGSRIRVVAVHSSGEAVAAGATRLVHGSYTSALRFKVVVEDLARQKMLPPEAPLNSLEYVTALPASWAGADVSQLEPFPTQSSAAMEAFARGRFEEAVTADPAMALAWRTWAELALQRNDAAALKTIVARGNAEQRRFLLVDRARWAVIAARASGDPRQLAAALAGLAHVQPGKVEALLPAASAAVAVRRLDDAIQFYQFALKIDPNAEEVWNNLGYVLAYAGRQQEAVDALLNYARLAPQSANPLDSLGEIQLRAGQFAEAARSFEQAYAKQPGWLNGYDLFKAAIARYWGGDEAGAQALAGKYFAGLAAGNPAAAEVERADWLYVQGRDQEARAALKKAADTQPALKAAVQSRLMLDDLGKATGINGGSEPMRAVWLTARGQYAEAESLWRKISAATSPADEDLSREMLLRCLVETGKKVEAKKLAAVWPLPRGQGEVLNGPSLLELAKKTRAGLK